MILLTPRISFSSSLPIKSPKTTKMEHIRSAILGTVVRRQDRECVRGEDGFFDPETCDVPFWYTKTGVIVKWSLFLGFTTLFSLYLLLGYLHARSRIKKGLPPLRYHKWLVSRRELARVDPRYQFPQPTAYNYYDPNNQMYGMQTMPPPPVYDPNGARPPMYEGPPPPGATKVDSNQAPVYRPADQQAEEYEAPPGPPPQNTIPAQNTGNTNPFRG